MTHESLWCYLNHGDYTLLEHQELPIDRVTSGEAGESYYYGHYSNARCIVFRCKPDKQPFRLDEDGTPGIYHGLSNPEIEEILKDKLAPNTDHN